MAAGQPVRFQLGEPWWWVMSDGRICLYDAAAEATFAPVPIADVRAPLGGAQLTTLDAAGAVLAASTAALSAAVRAEAPDAELLLLVYLPTRADGSRGEARQCARPAGRRPAFDVLQLEDYDWVTAGRAARGGAMPQRRWPGGSATRWKSSIISPASCASPETPKGSGRSIAAAAEAALQRGTGGDVRLGAAAGDPRRLCVFPDRGD